MASDITESRLTVLGRCETTKKLKCLCKCGGTKFVAAGNLWPKGTTSSCGCLRRELRAAKNKVHGYNVRGKRARLYNSWTNMVSRCTNPKNDDYKDYGGRGITVFVEWRESFEKFKDWALSNNYAEGLEIDRADNSRGYSPDNCRWVTHKQNVRNTRSNKNFEFNGETLCVSEWAEKHSINTHTLGGRLRRGWSMDKALLTPAECRPRKAYGSYCITVRGETLPFVEMAKKYNIPIQRAYDRVYVLGWGADDAFTLPKNTRLAPKGKTKCQ
jgi:hypothetical protein